MTGRRVPASLVAGSVLLSLVVLVAVFAGPLAPHDPYAQALLRRLRPPAWAARGSWDYPLGTDSFGRDVLSRLVWGTRIALLTGLGGAALGGLIGTSLGLLAGYAGGWVDRTVSLVVATRLALPSLLLALAILQLAGSGPGSGVGLVVLVLGITAWDRFAVVMRTATAQVRGLDYVLRARALGCSHARILLREVFPNVAGPFIVVFTFEVAQCILAAAVLSFLGLGIRAPQPSWGLMMAEGRNWLTVDPWLITSAGLALALLVLAVNLLGDGLRRSLARDGRI